MAYAPNHGGTLGHLFDCWNRVRACFDTGEARYFRFRFKFAVPASQAARLTNRTTSLGCSRPRTRRAASRCKRAERRKGVLRTWPLPSPAEVSAPPKHVAPAPISSPTHVPPKRSSISRLPSLTSGLPPKPAPPFRRSHPPAATSSGAKARSSPPRPPFHSANLRPFCSAPPRGSPKNPVRNPRG